MRDKSFSRLFIKVVELMILEVKISSISQSANLSPAPKWVIE